MSARTNFNFRQVFKAVNLQEKLTSWFPGHMYKGMQQMQRRLKDVDCIIEVHDARIPFSGRNPNLQTMLTAIKPHILVLNKVDLIDSRYKDKITELLGRNKVENVIFTNCKASGHGGINKIVPTAIEMMRNTERYHRSFNYDYQLMVIGVSNVGKSTLINRLRNVHMKKKSANPVGALPGITKSVLEKVKIYDDPPVFLYDTPGVMQPNIPDLEVAMRLALCCTLNDHLVGEELIADYLLYWLNKHEYFSYVRYLGLTEPLDDVRMLLIKTAKNIKSSLQIKTPNGKVTNIPNFKAAATHFIKAFRSGEFGKLMLDEDIVTVF